MEIEIQFIPEAQKDYKDLDGSIRKDVNKKLEKLKENPLIGFPLGNKYNNDLSGFYKLYAYEKKIRIVYRLLNPGKVEIVEIWGIGKREQEKIYKIIGERLARKK